MQLSKLRLSLIAAFTVSMTACAQTSIPATTGSLPAEQTTNVAQVIPASSEQITPSASAQLTQVLAAIETYENTLQPQRAVPILANVDALTLSQQHEQRSALLAQLLAIDPQALSRSEQITYQIQHWVLQNQVDLYQYQAHLAPFRAEYGFHSAVAALPQRTKIKTADDVQAYLDLLQSIPVYFAQQTDNLKQGLAQGITQPQAILAAFPDSIIQYIENPAQSVFMQPLLTAQADQASLSKAEQIIAEQVNPAFNKLYHFFKNTYIPNANVAIGVSSWPQGEAFYNNRIKHYTTTDLTAAEIHQLGLQEVARIRSEMQTILDELQFDGEISDFIQFLRTDPQFYAKTPDELMHYASYLSKRIDARLPQLFYTLPRTPYGVEPVPESIAPNYTTGRYVPSRGDDTPGYYWVNTYNLAQRPKYALPALTLHEAVPGHHLQIALTQELQDLPSIRKNAYITAFGEGWGLYSEYLGIEVGFYETPYDHFGRLSYEMWRACRLVVDTGMHMFDWSREQAVQYMLDNTALSEHNVNTEIDRYISWPGQALAYKIGELEIKALRKEAEQALGEDFDVRAFHDAVLQHGSLPLRTLRENIAIFITDAQGK